MDPTDLLSVGSESSKVVIQEGGYSNVGAGDGVQMYSEGQGKYY